MTDFDASLTATEGSEPPFAELAPNGHDIDECIAAAVVALSERRGQRDEWGRFALGNGGAVADGLRSTAFADALAPARDAIARQLMTDFGLDDGSPQIALQAVDLSAELTTFRKALGENLRVNGGPTTAGGRARRLMTPYLAMADREMKARVQLLELVKVERRAKMVGGADTFDAAIAREPEAR